MRWKRFLVVAPCTAAAAFVIWVDQSFGLAMWLGGLLVMVFAVVLLASLLVAGALCGVAKRRAI
jgi:glycine cleavage system pyridoxal-binding protein P